MTVLWKELGRMFEATADWKTSKRSFLNKGQKEEKNSKVRPSMPGVLFLPCCLIATSNSSGRRGASRSSASTGSSLDRCCNRGQGGALVSREGHGYIHLCKSCDNEI